MDFLAIGQLVGHCGNVGILLRVKRDVRHAANCVLHILADRFYLIRAVAGRRGVFRGILDLELPRGSFCATEGIARVDCGALGLNDLLHAPGKQVASQGSADDGFVEHVSIVHGSHCAK